jgi:hypothetical protein
MPGKMNEHFGNKPRPSGPSHIGREDRQEADYYLAHISSVAEIDDLLSDRRLYVFAMKAFGLADLIGVPAFIRKILAAGAAGSHAFTLDVTDVRIRQFVEAFDFKRHGPVTTARNEASRDVVERFIQEAIEGQVGAHDEAARLALYFRRKVAGAASIYGLMADKDSYGVLRMALGMPEVTSGSDLDKQSAEIARNICFGDFRDPDKLDAFLLQFTTEWRKRNRRSDGENPPPAVAGVMPQRLGGDVLLSLHAMKVRGM